jgi:hypothetical protein
MAGSLVESRNAGPFEPAAVTARAMPGARGPVRFGADGAARRPLAVVEVTPGGFVVLDPAAPPAAGGS